MSLARGTRLELSIALTWDGRPIDDSERVTLALEVRDHDLSLRVDAPFHGDPAPATHAGSTARLWEHEVVELMLLGDRDHYLEVELSPHGHYLVLLLEGRRHVVREGLSMQYEARVEDDRWRGSARVPSSWLPPACERLNAYAIHGQGTQRRYLAWKPRRDAESDVGPDFHHLETFGSFADCERVMLSRP